MYASQTKRLCVRGTQSEETSAHHHSLSPSQISEALLSSSSQASSNSPPTQAGPQRPSISSPAVMSAVQDALTDANISSDLASSDQQEARRDTFTNSVSIEQKLIDKLANETADEARLELILALRDQITACNKRKERTVNSKNFHKIISFIDDNELQPNVKTQLALLCCSVAKGGELCVRTLNEMLLDEKVLNLILNSMDDALIEASFRCFRSLMLWPKVSRLWLLYESHKPLIDSDQNQTDIPSKLEKIVRYALKTNSFIVQECIFDILAATCCRAKDQALLHKASALTCILKLMNSPSDRVVMGSLNLLTQMCLKNQSVSRDIVNTQNVHESPVLRRLSELMRKDRNHKLQFVAAQCYAHISRALGPEALRNDPNIVGQVLPTLVRLVHKDKSPYLRIKSAECIAYLIECETKLQNTASVCDRLIDSLANMLDCEQSFALIDTLANGKPSNSTRSSRNQERNIWHSSHNTTALDLKVATSEVYRTEFQSTNVEIGREMKRAAFLALAALASNLELIRKKIFTTDIVLQHLIKSLTDNDPRTLKSALTCLLSLSRSVQQLRTSFAENSGIVYSALKNLLTTASNDILVLVLAILCNISLDFSPGKQHFLDVKTIDLLCSFTKKPDPVLRLHGIWILMNMVYQLKDTSLKFQIIRSLGINHLLILLEDDDEELVVKTLGFLRNLLSHKVHTDAIMSNHGNQIIQALIAILNKPTSSKIQEQGLCVLTNIADGTESKKLIMSNRVILAYLARTMCDEQRGDLRLAAICCITNLAHVESEGSYERRDEMRKYGIEEKLKYMLNSNDPILSDRVRAAYNQFHLSSEDKYAS